MRGIRVLYLMLLDVPAVAHGQNQDDQPRALTCQARAAPGPDTSASILPRSGLIQPSVGFPSLVRPGRTFQ